MNPLAEELNQIILSENQAVFRLLSNRGRRLFFPRGILSQSQEAKKKAWKANATIGMASDGKNPLYLQCIHKHFKDIQPSELYPYAPATGVKDLRDAWLSKLQEENPGLSACKTSLPLVTAGLTHGLSIIGDLFVDPGDVVVIPDKMWGNYKLIFGVRMEASITTFPFYTEKQGFNVSGLERVLSERPRDAKTIVILNFPNNPAGYSVTKEEGTKTVKVLEEQSTSRDLLVVLDDAYFGLFYEDRCLDTSLFSSLCSSSPRLMAVKADAATKEEFVWGFRCGFLTFGVKDGSQALYGALEKKTAGAVRGSVSNAAHVSQSLVLRALKDPDFRKEQRETQGILCERAQKAKKAACETKYSDLWDVYPFNSGYFMCLRIKPVKAEPLRVHLLNNYGIGTIATGEYEIRLAFSSVPARQIEELFEDISAAIRSLAGQGMDKKP